MKKLPRTPQIPSLGQILKFLLNCFDIRRDGNPLVYKQVERLAKEKNISREAMEKVARSILDTINFQLNAEASTGEVTKELLRDWSENPKRWCGLRVNSSGDSELHENQILQDMIEFCWRHQFLLPQLEDCRSDNGAAYYWLLGFVIPYIASTLVDYKFTAKDPESGMPGGRLWYLPLIELAGDNAETRRLVLPSQQVLRWWEDLLGRRLEHFHKELCGESSDPDNARRQIDAWKTGQKPPDSETIRRWTKQTWDYKGTFKDMSGGTLNERWQHCREFLVGKGMLEKSDWLKAATASPFDPERRAAERYRGEKLEQEIPPFHNFPFERFFNSKDPITEELPVEELIQRVSVRWRVPTRVELHSRLIIGRAMNLAWNACAKAFGINNVSNLTCWVSCSYNHFMEIAMRSENLSAQEGMRMHCELAEPTDPAFHPLAAMLDEDYWRTLTQCIRQQVKSHDPNSLK